MTQARPRWRRRLGLGLLGLLAVLLLAAGWLGFQVYRTGTALKDAQAEMPPIGSHVNAATVSLVSAAAPAVQRDLARARSSSDDPVWRVAEHLPWAGPHLRAVRAVTTSLDDVLTAVTPVLDRAEGLLTARDTLLANGKVDVTPFVDAEPELAHASAVTQEASARIGAVDTGGLVKRVAKPIDRLQQELPKLSSALGTASSLAALLPPMLGADGPRTYLVVALNSAELRSAGGIVGSIAAVDVDHGVVRLGEQRSTADLRPLPEPVLPLTDAERAIDTDRLGRYVQDAVLTPDFPRSAELLAARWQQSVGVKVDGVVATDPVAVSYLLGAVGSVKTSGGSLDQKSAVRALLRDPYRAGLDSAKADGYFEEAATAIFAAAVSGKAKPSSLVDAVTKATHEGRVRVWSAHPEEQARLAANKLGAAFLSGRHEDATGVFLNDGTGGKLGYYLQATVSVENLQCTGGTPTADVRLDLVYEPPADLAKLSPAVIGRAAGAPVGSLVTNVSFYGPGGASPPTVQLGDDAFVSGTSAQVGDRSVQVVSSTLAPGDKVTYRLRVPVRDGRVEVWTTPTVRTGAYVDGTCPGR